MRKFTVTVNGQDYDVVVKDGGAAAAAPAPVAAAPAAAPAPAPVAAAPACWRCSCFRRRSSRSRSYENGQPDHGSMRWQDHRHAGIRRPVRTGRRRSLHRWLIADMKKQRVCAAFLLP